RGGRAGKDHTYIAMADVVDAVPALVIVCVVWGILGIDDAAFFQPQQQQRIDLLGHDQFTFGVQHRVDGCLVAVKICAERARASLYDGRGWFWRGRGAAARGQEDEQDEGECRYTMQTYTVQT